MQQTVTISSHRQHWNYVYWEDYGFPLPHSVVFWALKAFINDEYNLFDKAVLVVTHFISFVLTTGSFWSSAASLWASKHWCHYYFHWILLYRNANGFHTGLSNKSWDTRWVKRKRPNGFHNRLLHVQHSFEADTNCNTNTTLLIPVARPCSARSDY